jgi:hypothetical protein
VNDDETQILSVPVRLRRAGREIRMVIDGTDPFAASKPDARLIRLLIRACRFNAALAQGEGIHFAGSGGCCSNATIASGAGLAREGRIPCKIIALKCKNAALHIASHGPLRSVKNREWNVKEEA